MKRYVRFKEDEEGRKYPYIDVGSEAHGRPSFRLWVSGRLLKKDENGFYIEFPLKNARIEKTPRGNLVLRPREGSMVYDIFVPCGYRGDSFIQVLSEHGEEFHYYVYESPRGSLGISEGVLVNAPIAPLKYKWRRSGRTYGKPNEGITIVMPDGEETDFEEIPDGLEALEELRDVLGD